MGSPVTTWAWGSGPATLVFLHALLPAATGRSAEPVAVDLTKRLPVRVVGVDAPGFGASPTLPDAAYELTGLANLIADAVADVVEPRYLLAGHSWGAALAVRITATRPRDVAGLVLLDGGHFDHADLQDADPSQTVEQTVAEMAGMGWHHVDHPPPLPPAWRAGLRPATGGGWESTASPRAAGAAMNHLMRSRSSEFYGRIAAHQTPVLLLTATEPEQRRRDNERRTAYLLRALPHARAQPLVGSGHDVLADAPEQVAEAIARWWENLDLRSPPVR